jgi:hypothetical protein
MFLDGVCVGLAEALKFACPTPPNILLMLFEDDVGAAVEFPKIEEVAGGWLGKRVGEGEADVVLEKFGAVEVWTDVEKGFGVDAVVVEVEKSGAEVVRGALD